MNASKTAEREKSDVVLVTGVSGGGKSIAMHALEDAGFFCVDNLPPELLLDFLTLERQRGQRRVAIAVDVRSAGSLPHLLPLIKQLRAEGVALRSIFLDANTETLMRRFSETRRPHPLRQSPATPGNDSGEDEHRALLDAIHLERELLAALRVESTDRPPDPGQGQAPLYQRSFILDSEFSQAAPVLLNTEVWVRTTASAAPALVRDSAGLGRAFNARGLVADAPILLRGELPGGEAPTLVDVTAWVFDGTGRYTQVYPAP